MIFGLLDTRFALCAVPSGSCNLHISLARSDLSCGLSAIGRVRRERNDIFLCVDARQVTSHPLRCRGAGVVWLTELRSGPGKEFVRSRPRFSHRSVATHYAPSMAELATLFSLMHTVTITGEICHLTHRHTGAWLPQSGEKLQFHTHRPQGWA